MPGPVAAMALQRAGIDSTIYEARTPEESAGGAFLSVAVNGLDALRAVQSHHRVLEAGFRSRTIEVDDAGPAVEVIRATTELSVGANQYDMPRVPLWWRGPMIVIGDAAYAASPNSAGRLPGDGRCRDVGAVPP